MKHATLLDGGMGQELLRRTNAVATPLWSAQVMYDHPDVVQALHLDYINAGADVITLNAYSSTRCRLEPSGFVDRYEPLQRLAGELALAARDESGHDVTIAGCLSPYGWSYHPELAPPFDELWPQYAETAALQAPYVDVFLCETMGSAEEALAAATGAATTGKPVWVAWTLRDDDRGVLRSGETLAAANAALDDLDVAVRLLNCSTPEAITAALPALLAAGPRVGAYANGFTQIDAAFTQGATVEHLHGRSDLGHGEYADVAMGWLDSGARVVGGCCEIGPAHIAEIARRLDVHGWTHSA